MKKITTKEKILKAARTLFVEHGFAGTSIGKIAELASVNHSLIFHHFGNKEKLWLAVKQDITKENSHTSRLPSTTLPFPEFLKSLLTENIHFYRNNLDIVRIMNWQRLESSENPIGITRSSAMKDWMKAFSRYQEQGDIRRDIKLEHVITLVLGMTSSAALDPNIFIRKKKDLDNYIEFCVRLLTQGIK